MNSNQLEKKLAELRCKKLNKREVLISFAYKFLEELGVSKISIFGFNVDVLPYIAQYLVPAVMKMSDAQIEKVKSLLTDLLSDLNES